MARPLSREYLEDKATKARDAITFASPRADTSFASATLAHANAHLAKFTGATFRIAYFNRSLNRPVTATYATLQDAKAAAEEIFRRTGIVVGIDAV